MGVIQIIKENCKEILCLKLKLRFLEIISKMNQFIFYLSGTGLLCEMRQAYTWYGFNGNLWIIKYIDHLDCFLSSAFLPAFKTKIIQY